MLSCTSQAHLVSHTVFEVGEPCPEPTSGQPTDCAFMVRVVCPLAPGVQAAVIPTTSSPRLGLFPLFCICVPHSLDDQTRGISATRGKLRLSERGG